MEIRRTIEVAEPLEACPFCGSYDIACIERDNISGGFSVFFVECHQCEARGGIATNEESAVKNWNTRTI